MNKINYIKGDATKPVGSGNKFIIHVCNNRGGFGRGFVLSISKKWSKPESVYRECHGNNYSNKLGNIQIVTVAENLWVVNIIAQDGFKSEDNPVPASYKHLSFCLKKVAERAIELNASIHMPRICTGLGGGLWEEVELLIEECLLTKDLDVFVYDFEK